jgi:type II secretory pathway pseudopilin PulG
MELLIVIAIIAVLGGLILAAAGYVQKNGKRSRAEAEIAAMTAALENYKADNGAYPSDAITNNLDVTTANISDYNRRV